MVDIAKPTAWKLDAIAKAIERGECGPNMGLVKAFELGAEYQHAVEKIELTPNQKILAQLESGTADLTLVTIGQALKCFDAQANCEFRTGAFVVKIVGRTGTTKATSKDFAEAMLAAVKSYLRGKP